MLCKNHFNLFFHFFIIKIKNFECPKSIRNYEKRIMLGTSDTWSMSRLSQGPSNVGFQDSFPYLEKIFCYLFSLLTCLDQ